MEKEKKIHFLTFDEIDSTNEWAKRNISECPRSMITCIVAKSQTSGKGRWAKKWQSPEGNLYSSFCLFTKNEELISHVGQIIAIAAAKVLKQLSLHPLLKWPNDIIVNQKKISGILTECIQEKDTFFVIIGMGLNINMTQKDLSLIDKPATSLYLETGKEWNVQEVLEKIAAQFLHEFTLLEKNGFSAFSDFFNDHLFLKGEKIAFLFSGKEQEGRCLAVNEQGKLEVELTSGDLITVSSGEIRSVRSLDQE